MHKVFFIIILAAALLLASLPPAYCLPSAAFADVVEVSSTFGGGQETTGFTADVPPASASQLVVAVIYISHTTTSNPVLTAPDGWSSLGAFAGVFQFVQIFYRTGNGQTSATWTVTLGTTKYSYRIAVYNNANLASPINVSAGSSTNVSTFHFAPSVTTTVANCLVVAVWGSGDSRISFLTDSSMTERFNAAGSTEGNALAISDVIKTTAGGTGQKLASANEASYGANFTFAIAPALSTTVKRKRPPLISE